jgi:aqualysin 1
LALCSFLVASSAFPADCNGHGTHVSALAAGTKYGAAKNASIIAVRVYGCNNEGPVSQVIAGINYVLGRMRTSGRRSVVNMSFGGNRIPALDRAVQVLVDAGAVVVAAAGNENVDACNTSPGGASASFTVGAAENGGSYASFSNFGSCVAIVAPGVNLRSAWIGSSSATETLSGTSMAAPVTAGVVALYLEGNPGASVDQVKNDIVCSATTNFLKDLPTSSTPDRFLYSPPGGFVSGW